MDQSYRDLLALALGVAISPVPILAVIIMVLADGSRASSRGFVLGWVVGIASTCSVFVLLSSVMESQGDSGWLEAESFVWTALGALFALLAVVTWRRRPRAGQVPELPRWLATVDRLSVGRALVLGWVLAVLNPKNLVIFPVAGSTIAQQGSSVVRQVMAVLAFTCLAASTVALPMLAGALGKERMSGTLDRIRAWLVLHTSVVIVLLASTIAAVLLARGISGLL